MTLPHEFIFVLVQYFSGTIVSENSCVFVCLRVWGGGRKVGEGGWKKHKKG